MPTINKRFLFKLLVIFALIAGAIAGLHTIQAQRIPDALKRQAEMAMEAEKPDRAIRFLRQYLEFSPDDVNVQEQLAELLRNRTGDAVRNELIFLYDKILRNDPARTTVRREAIIACLQLNRYTDAASHAEALLILEPNDSSVWRYLGRAQVGKREFDGAQKSFEKAIECDPHALLGYQQLAEFHWLDRQQLADARAIYDRMIIALPNSSEAYFSRAKFLARSARPTEPFPASADDPVLADLDKALKLDPTNAEASLLLGERWQRHRNVLEARTAFRNALAHHPDDERLVRSLAWLEANRGNLPGAIRVLEDAVAQSADGIDLLVTLADLLLQSGDTSRTLEVIQRIEKHRGENVSLRAEYLRGRHAMKNEQWNQALAAFQHVRSESVDLPALETQANLMIATCHSRLGETDKAIESLQLVTLKEPANVNARSSLAELYLNAGQFAKAVREYDVAAQQPAAPPGILTTLVQLKSLRLGSSQKPELWVDLERETLALANRLGARTADGQMMLADLAFHAQKYSNALDILQKALQQHSNDERVWSRLATCVSYTHGVAAALRILDEAQAVVGDRFQLRLTRAEVYSRDPAQLRPLAHLESQIDSWSEDDQTRFLYGLIDVYDRMGDQKNVLRLYKIIAARRPREVSAWLAICERAWEAGDADSAREAMTRLGQIPDCPPAINSIGIAWQELAGGKPITVRDQLEKLPNHADACRVLARQFDLENRTDRASELFHQAVRMEPTRFEPAIDWIVHLANHSRLSELKQYLEQLATDPRWSDEPFRRTVRLAIRKAGSLEISDRILSFAQPRIEQQAGGLGWLADLQAQQSRKPQAIALAKRAVEQRIATPDDWLRLVLLVEETSGRKASLSLVQSAKARLSGQGFTDLVAAYTASKPDRADAISANTAGELRQLTDARLQILQAQWKRTEAIQECESALKDSRFSETDKRAIKRKLAMLLTVRGEPSDRLRALQLLANDRSGTIHDRRATAAVLASLHRFLDGQDRALAITSSTSLLEALAAEPSREQPRDLYALSQIYQTAGRTNDAVQVLQKLLNAQPNHVEYLLAALNIMCSSNPKNGEPFAERLMSVAPRDFRVIASVARLNTLLGNPQKAVELAEQYERTADLSAGEQMIKTARAAELLDQLSRDVEIAKTPAARMLADRAVSKYETVLHSQPQLLTNLAIVLAANGRTDEAFDWIDRQTEIVPDYHRAMAGIAAIRVGGVAEHRSKQVQIWLSSALTKEPASRSLQLGRAEFLLLSNDLAEAEKAYESILRNDDRNTTALNNLAWILAPRPDAATRAEVLLKRAAQESGLTGELLDTRARIRISANQPQLAEQDAREALKQDQTALRYFHLALAQLQQDPDKGQSTYQEARKRGLSEKSVHPLDRALLQKLEKAP